MRNNKSENDTIVNLTDAENQATKAANFKIVKAKIQEMYKDDRTVRNNIRPQATTDSVQIKTFTIDSFKQKYFNVSADLGDQRKLAFDAYTFYPVFANVIDYLANMCQWKYTYIPRAVKEKAQESQFEEAYNLMGEVVDGLSVETVFPLVLKELFINGAVFLLTTKTQSSKTITTLKLPYKYCRLASITQYGTIVYQFDLSYFDDLQLSAVELEEIFKLYPKELHSLYNEYLTDKQNKRWITLDPKQSAAFVLNDRGFPTKAFGLVPLKQYEQYLDNELERNGQLLDKIITHKIPTWQDKLVVDIDEMAELHKSMAQVVKKNNHVRLLTSFGDVHVESIGEDTSKENKTLNNAYNAIYDNNGLNHSLFNGEDGLAKTLALVRDKAFVMHYVQQLVSFYNIVINNSYNFHGYQCDFNILPITAYDNADMLNVYKDGATLGASKLEYIVALGVKQIDIPHKLKVEELLQLDQLKPLSTSYTQSDSNQTVKDNNNKNTDQEENKNE